MPTAPGTALSTLHDDVRSHQSTRIRRITSGQLLVVAAFVVILCVLVRRGGDPDIFWHLVTGQWMVDHRQVVSQDLFTFTVSGKQWIDPEYTTEIIAYLVYKVGGLALVSLGFGAVTFAGFLLIWRRVRLERANLVIAAIAIGIAGLGGAEVWGPRPQMITFTFTCLEVLWLDRYLRGKSRAIYWLPLVMVAWANLHGGFLFGLVPVGVAAFVEAVHWVRRVDGDEHKRRTRNLILIFVACVVAAVINPNGIHLYGYVIQPQFSAVQQSFIAEWQSPNFHVLEERGFELMLLMIPLAFMLRRPSLWDVCLTLAVSYLALSAVRHSAPFVAAETPLLIWSFSVGWERMALATRVRDVGRAARSCDARRRGRDLPRSRARHRVLRALHAVQSGARDGGELPGRCGGLARGASRTWGLACSTSTAGADTSSTASTRM